MVGSVVESSKFQNTIAQRGNFLQLYFFFATLLVFCLLEFLLDLFF